MDGCQHGCRLLAFGDASRDAAFCEILVVHWAGQVDVAVLVVDQDWSTHLKSKKSVQR